MSRKFALVIGNTEYTDPGLMQLSAPGADAQDFGRILKDNELCAFDDVKVLTNVLSSTAMEAIDDFFDEKKPDDLLVLYFSGHGVRDELGALYLAFKNTLRSRLRATAIKSDYIRESMDESRSKRQVIVLDCCNSGAFPQGTKAAIGGPMGLRTAFEGYGRVVLMASDATQFSWEGNQVIGETSNSLFTHFLIKGLEGDADSDGDGRITVDELYDYAFEQISKVTEKQTPTKAASKVTGDIILRQITRLEDVRPVELPRDLLDEIEDTRPYVREAAVQKLEKILQGTNLGLVRSAISALEKIAADPNTTRHVAETASQILQSYRDNPPRPQPEEATAAAVRPVDDGRPAPAANVRAQSSTAASPQLTPASGAHALPQEPKRLLMWGGGLVGLLAIGLLAFSLVRGPTRNAPEAAPTTTAAADSPTQAPTDLPTAAASLDLPTEIAATLPGDHNTGVGAVPVTALEPRIGNAAESIAAWRNGTASLWDKATAQNDKLDDSQPGVFSYPVTIARSERVRWEWFWCSQSQAILEDNLQSIRVKFELDGQDITSAVQNGDFQNEGWYCRTYFVSVGNWPAGTFQLTDTISLAVPVSDGSSQYMAGDYVYKYTVTAH